MRGGSRVLVVVGELCYLKHDGGVLDARKREGLYI